VNHTWMRNMPGPCSALVTSSFRRDVMNHNYWTLGRWKILKAAGTGAVIWSGSVT